MTFKKWQYKNLSLRTKLLLSYIIITIIPVSLIGYITYQQYKFSIEKEVGTYIPQLLNQANNNIEKDINRYLNEMDLILKDKNMMNILRNTSYENISRLKQDEHEMRNFLSNSFMMNSRNHIIGVFIYSNNRLFSNSKIPYSSGYSTVDKIGLYGKLHKFNDQGNVFFPHQTVIDFQNNKPFVLLVKQIKDVENRRILGNIFVALDIDFITETIKTVDEKKEANMWLIDKDGYIIYHSDRKLIGSIDNERKKYPTQNGSFQAKGVLYSSSSSKDNAWTFLHTVPVDLLTMSVNAVRNASIISFIMIALLAIFSAVLLSWSVSKPIHQLAQKMKKVEKGDFSVRFKTDSEDEIGILSKAFSKMLMKIEELINEKYEMEIKQKEAELYALQSQINPHFMYNTLENMSVMVEEDETEQVVDVITNLGRMLHYSLGNSDPMVMLKSEIQHIESYLSIQKARFEEKIEYLLDIDSSLFEYKIPKFILQPLVENAIEHGFRYDQLFKIHVLARKYEDLMQIVVEDNGGGIKFSTLQEIEEKMKDTSTIHKDRHFGISNVNGRLILHFGKENQLKIESVYNQGTKITINVPI